MQGEQQLRASLKEIDDLKVALDQHAIVAFTDSRKSPCPSNKRSV
jgi:hypothetical protein